MCTVVLSFAPESPTPVLLIGVRDEFLDRDWVGPGRHWPQWPELVGGRDLLAGGTWLAVHPSAPRVACILNGHGRDAAEDVRVSRGELPLRLAAGVPELAADPDLGRVVEPTRYDPFHLVCAAPDAAWLWSWDGERLVSRVLAPGLHIVVNSGLDGGDAGVEGPGVERMRARVEYFRPLLAAAHRPAAHGGTVAAAWDDWLALADGGGLDPADERALLVRADFEGRAWGTSSISLVALGRDHVRYDFRAAYGGGAGRGDEHQGMKWTTVLDAGTAE